MYERMPEPSMYRVVLEATRRGGRNKVRCGYCGGTGTVPVDPRDRRAGQTTCPKCGGNGEI